MFDCYSRAQHFSPDPAMLFSGVVACVTDVRLSPQFLRVRFTVTFFSLCRPMLKYYLLESRRLGGSGAQYSLAM
jgi:hypothetical protein